VPFEIRLDQSNTNSDVWLWVGKDGAKCEQLTERDDTKGLCAELARNPQRVALNETVTDLFLQDLLDPVANGSPIASCESSGLAGTNYQIFVFREAPSSDVAPERYGIVEFAIDVENPAPPLVNTNAQRQSIFTVEWDPANPPDDIQNWDLWYSTDSMPTPERTGKTASGEGQSKISISADELNLSEGESATLYARAYDIAFVSDNFGGNASDLSAGVPVTVVAVAGYCDLSGNCGGCSVSPLGLAGRTPSAIFLAFGFAFAALLAWRLRR
ncbi:MAG: hypothetical protein WBN30_12940, partial [Polyangiales bacterium]